MALKKCHECKNVISDQAESCLSCGAPVNNKKSKPGGGCLSILVLVGVGSVAIYYAGSGLYLSDRANSWPPQTAAPEKPKFMFTADPAPTILVDRISSGLEQDFTLRNAYIAGSEVHERVYFIAAELVGPGSNGTVALWAHIGDPEGSGLTYSVDGYAVEFSDWGDVSTTKADVSQYDPPARKLKGFVQDKTQ